MIRIGLKALERIREKCKRITRSSDPTDEKTRLNKLDEVIRGWVNYFRLAKARSIMEALDQMVRTRLRITKWRHWKRIRTRIANLIKLGIAKSQAYQWENSSRGACRIAHSPILSRTLTTNYWGGQGYKGFFHYYWQTDGQQSIF